MSRVVIVDLDDLKNVLDVYIDNGMVEDDDEAAAVNRMYAQIKAAS